MMEAVSSGVDAPDPVSQVNERDMRPAERRSWPFSRRSTVIGSLAWILLASVVAIRQSPAADPFSPPRGASWWLHPIERNALLRLPATGEVNRLTRHPDSGHLFGVGRAGLVLRSVDGGHTWDQRPVVWSVGEQPAATRTQTTAQLLRDDVRHASLDVPKGRPQQQQQQIAPPVYEDNKAAPNLNRGDPVAPAATPRPYADLDDIEFVAGGRGWITGDNGTILVTEDRGATWRVGADASPTRLGSTSTTSWAFGSRPFENMTASFSDNPRRGWAGDAAGRVHYTTDAGASWETRQLPLARPVRSLVASDEVVIAALEGYGLAKSDDGGDSWSLLSAPAVRGAHFLPDGLHGWAVGDAGLILRTDDAGVSWSVVSSGTTASLHDVHFVEDGSRGWIAASGPAILQTSDAGRSWTADPVGDPLETITAVRFDRSGRRGIALGAQLRITADGGETWTVKPVVDRYVDAVSSASGDRTLLHGTAGAAQYSFSSDVLARAVPIAGATAFVEDPGGRMWAVGNQGLLAETSDVGAPWRRRGGVLPSDFAPTSIAFSADGSRGWIAGKLGELWVTGDAGTTWRRQAVQSTARWTGIEPLPRGAAVALTNAPLMYRTPDGSEWTPITYAAYPAPWYYLAIALGLGVMALVVSSSPEIIASAKPSVADVFVSDRPLERGDPDALALNGVASGIARFLANEKTDPPLTIAVTGEWGSGKTSLMNLSRGMLQDFGFRTVWFNAWHHQTEEHLLGALIESLRRSALQPWWAPRGFAVRIRLLMFRGMRQWLPAAAALVGFGIAAGYFLQQPADRLWDAGSWLKGLLNFDASRLTTEHTFDVLSILGTAGGLTRLVRGMQAFGVSGKRLSTALTSYDPLKDLRLPTGFRHQFADTFRDITRALAPQQLVIFIDDLDRCQPANVVATLEMVNFLVSSGRCIVIIGMARDRVERCVGIGFKDVAELGADEVGTGDPQVIASRRLERFARQYLEKLINIEIPVPKASPSASKELLSAAIHRREAYRQRWASTAVSVGQWLSAAVVVMALASAGYQGGIWIHREAARIDARERGEASRQTQQVSTPQAQTPVTASPGVVPGSDSETPPLEAVLVPGAEGVPSWPPVALMLGLGVLLAVPRLARVPVHVEHDSTTFTNALDRWFPLVYGKTSTPRAIKRFLNRVRFYAMSQREGAGPAPDGATRQIPEEALVALSVMQHAGASTVDEALAQVALDVDPMWRVQLQRDLEAALPCRDAFRRMSEGVSI